MFRPAIVAAILLLFLPGQTGAVPQRFENPPHDYWTRPLSDPFTRWLEKVQRGEASAPSGDELAVMREYLKIFNVPVTSQMIVYSATSRQNIISPSRPRALYFNEDLYIGFVPGGRIEVASVDPAAGPVFRIFDFPRGERAGIQPDRSTRCMECHAGHDNHQLPKLMMDSVIVNSDGGSLETWRTIKFGHEVPLSERFGGWHLTGGHHLTNHHGNTLGQLSGGRLSVRPNPPGQLFSLAKFPLPTSDILPQLLHDHQTGFHNHLTEAVYRQRELLAASKGTLTAADEKELDILAGNISDYVLFKNEAKLPAAGITGDPAYITDFRANRRAITGGYSLKDFDLKTRLFRYRCSYMLYSQHWTEFDPALKTRCWSRLKTLLHDRDPGHAAWLPATERAAIRKLLAGTLTDAPPEWK